MLTILALYGPPATIHDWALVGVAGTDRKYWQALSPRSVFTIKDDDARRREIDSRRAAIDHAAGNNAGCPVGMVRVKGTMPESAEILGLQNAACEDPGWNPKYLCNRFDPAKLPPLKTPVDALPSRDLDYCIDRYEFPNIPGEYPGTLLSYADGVDVCAAAGKRLCTENEWTFACEGPKALPYPYGFARYLDPNAHFPDRIITGDGCNIDVIRHGVHFDPKKMLSHKWELAGLEEVDRLWAGTRAGERSACVSPFGVYDITGNIEEWVRNDASGAHASVLKGGYWSPVESRCQPSNTAHGPGHSYYQTGFRCCSSSVVVVGT